MGILISRFRKKPSTKDKLQEIEQELEDIEDFRFSTQQLQRRWVGRLIIFSVIFYLFGALLFFLYFFPSELSKQLLYSLPLLVFPLIVYALKWLLHWYYAYKLSQNTDQMVLLQRKKKKLLKEVMTTETYVVAKEILEKYDPDQIRQKVGIIPFSTPSASTVTASLPDTGVRRRPTPTRFLPTQPIRPMNANIRGVVPIRPGYNAPPGTTVPAPSYPRFISSRPQGVPLPCPILPRQRGTIDRLVEFVVGDGPNNRYALICQQCQSHNGMALREEFEYIDFRCCYCYYLNPARKRRPLPPRLLAAPLSANPGASGDKPSESEEASNEGPSETKEDNECLQSNESITGDLAKIQSLTSTDKDGTSDEQPLHTSDGLSLDGDSIVVAADCDKSLVLETPNLDPVVELPEDENADSFVEESIIDIANDGEMELPSHQKNEENDMTSQLEGGENLQSDE